MEETTMKNNDEEVKATSVEIIDKAIEQVIDTFKFHGIELKRMDLNKDGTPEVNISVSKSKRYRELDDTLNFAYWTLWILLYGEHNDEKASRLKLNLNYEEVE